MRRWLFVVVVVALSLLAVSPALAQEDMGCAHDMATIAELGDWVVHASEMGHIDSGRVAQKLLNTLDKAQAKLDRCRVNTAIEKLEDFVEMVQEQSGRHIDPTHAEHLIEHARLVIATLDD